MLPWSYHRVWRPELVDKQLLISKGCSCGLESGYWNGISGSGVECEKILSLPLLTTTTNHLLPLLQATFASKVELAEKAITVTREVDGGVETIKTPLPAVLTTDLR